MLSSEFEVNFFTVNPFLKRVPPSTAHITIRIFTPVKSFFSSRALYAVAKIFPEIFSCLVNIFADADFCCNLKSPDTVLNSTFKGLPGISHSRGPLKH